MGKSMELQELEDKVELADLRVKQAEKAYKSQQAQAKQEQKAIDDYNGMLANLKVEYTKSLDDPDRRRSLEIQIRTMTDAGGPSLPHAQVESQTIADNGLKQEYATLTRITPTNADEALKNRQRMNQIESELRKPKSINATFFVGR
jgi:septal ring factor EnvC (AmiA/AmiB activator)